MYHYFYKITNKLNNHYYYGIHSTDNLNDGYMGSGRKLRRAINKYKKVKKEYLDEYISLGWKAGRVIKNKNTGL